MQAVEGSLGLKLDYWSSVDMAGFEDVVDAIGGVKIDVERPIPMGGGKSMSEKLSAEIVDAFNSQGGAFKRKEDMHRMAEANRAFAYFRF